MVKADAEEEEEHPDEGGAPKDAEEEEKCPDEGDAKKHPDEAT
jgi:hypothetical protein